jgi:hypothetical protein
MIDRNHALAVMGWRRNVCPDPASAPRSQSTSHATTTDVHGRVRAWDQYANQAETVRGLTRAATIIDSVRAANPGRDTARRRRRCRATARTSPPGFARSHESHIAAMNAMHTTRLRSAITSTTTGPYPIPRLSGEAPFLSRTLTGSSPREFTPIGRTIVESGSGVGIVGTTPRNVRGCGEHRGRLRFGDVVPAVGQAVQEAARRGADIVLVTVHSGLNEPSSYDTVTTNAKRERRGAIAGKPGIDLVEPGTPQGSAALRSRDLLVQPKNWATSVDVVHPRFRTAVECLPDCNLAGFCTDIQFSSHWGEP